MKCPVAAALLSLAANPALAEPFRLSELVRPERYDITLTPDLERARFSGEESIAIVLGAETKEIVLHAAELEITVARLTAGGRSRPVQVRKGPAPETVALRLDRPAPKGRAVLALKWRGRLTHELRGLYLVESEGKKYAFTQFESTDARRAFPCFDEPAFKARFQVSAVIDRAYTAVSNGAVTHEDTHGSKRLVRFEETPPLSSYLVALAVGPLSVLEAPARPGKPRFRVLTPSGKEHLGKAALAAGVELLDRLEGYFGVPYPYGKMDLVAVPELPSGGMENAGAIFFREDSLLLDEAAAPDDRHQMVSTLAHELAHQWFGDLVTMAWWDDLWLNEAFATWAEARILADWKPDWAAWLEFSAAREAALNVDALRATHPIHVPIQSAEEIDENFDEITYSKGAAVLRMLETYVGADSFQRAVTEYLSTHSGSNARAADFFTALAHTSTQPVLEVASSWFEQPGYPVVSVATACSGGRTVLDVEAERFFADAGPSAPGRWVIPLCARQAGVQHCELVRGGHARIPLPGRSPAGACDTVAVDALSAGFYRVAYDPVALAAMMRDPARLAPEERINLLSDTWAFAARGTAPLEAWLELVRAFRGDRAPEVNRMIAEKLQFLDEHLVEEADRAHLRALVEETFGPLGARLGFMASPSDDDRTRMLRREVLEALGRLGGDARVLDEAERRLPAALDGAGDAARDGAGEGDGAVTEAVLALGARRGGARAWASYREHLRRAPTARRHLLLLRALSTFEEPELVARTLDLTLGDDVPSEDVAVVLSELLGNPGGRLATLAFIEKRFPAILAKAPAFGLSRIVTAFGNFCDDAAAAEIERFFSSPAHHFPASARELQQAIEQVHECVGFKRREAKNLASWLHRRVERSSS